MTYDKYARWRDHGCPCGRVDCTHYEPGDQEAQCCYGEVATGGSVVETCKGYVPDPFVVAAWGEQGEGKAVAT